MSQAKTVNLYAITPFKLDGEHVAVGTVIEGVESERAKELTGAGRTRLASAEEAAPKRAKAEAAAKA